MGFPELDAVLPDARLAPIVVVDDDPAGASLTLAALETGGYAGVGEADGDAVLRLVRTALTNLVVSELYVPCAEGACLVTALKQDRARLPRLRVLVHTRHTREADTVWALAAGCDALVPKPAGAAVLLREVRRLEGGRQHDPARSGGRSR
jgi:CheY-like chemotaxis protein